MDGELVQMLGAYVSAAPVLEAPEMEQLNDIPVALKDAGIPLDFAPILFSGNAKSYIRRGQEFEKLGKDNISSYEQGVHILKMQLRVLEKQKLFFRIKIVWELIIIWLLLIII